MDIRFISIAIIVLALLFANLPFINQRVFGFIPLARNSRNHAKPFWARLLEMAILYVGLGSLSRLLEASIGNIAQQSWEFYAITMCLFIVLAYPGFVWQYLRKRSLA